MTTRTDAFITPEVLRWARDSINMDPAEAADRIGVRRDLLIDWEDGIERPSLQQLRKCSEVYKRPLAAFYLPAPPRDFNVPRDFRRIPDAKRGKFSPEFLIEMRRMSYQRAVAAELSEGGEVPQAIRPRLGSVGVEADAVAVASEVRGLLGITLQQQTAWSDPYTALNAWKNAIERLGALVFHFERVKVDEARGVSRAEFPFPFIGLNGGDSPRGRVFTLLHEFCHLLLEEGGVCDTIEYARTPAEPRERVEAFCNRVAGAVLVPAEALLAHSIIRAHGRSPEWLPDELRGVGRSFGVSTEVVLRRLLALGRTTVAFYQQRRKELAPARRRDRPPRIPQPRRVLRRVGQPFARIVLAAHQEERITSSDVSEYLGTKLKWVPKIESLLESANVLTGGDR